MTISAQQFRIDPMIQQQIDAISALTHAHLRQVLDYSKAVLDKLVPLERGSHQQVSCYVVYYQHVLAFFPDGQSTGLQNPAQFKAFCGRRDTPDSLLFEQGERLLEISLCKSGTRGRRDLAGVDDVELQMDEQHWFSIIDGEMRSGARGCRGQLCYTAKDGSDFRL